MLFSILVTAFIALGITSMIYVAKELKEDNTVFLYNNVE